MPKKAKKSRTRSLMAQEQCNKSWWFAGPNNGPVNLMELDITEDDIPAEALECLADQ
jgi:hypothetical protein